jgi:hypothetical protein
MGSDSSLRLLSAKPLTPNSKSICSRRQRMQRHNRSNLEIRMRFALVEGDGRFMAARKHTLFQGLLVAKQGILTPVPPRDCPHPIRSETDLLETLPMSERNTAYHGRRSVRVSPSHHHDGHKVHGLPLRPHCRQETITTYTLDVSTTISQEFFVWNLTLRRHLCRKSLKVESAFRIVDPPEVGKQRRIFANEMTL